MTAAEYMASDHRSAGCADKAPAVGTSKKGDFMPACVGPAMTSREGRCGPAQWYRASPDRRKRMTVGLTYEEKGVLADMLDLMHESQRPLPNDPDRLRLSLPGLTRGRIRKMLPQLERAGAITIEPGGIWSNYMTEEFKFREEKSQKLSKNSRERWKKDNENNDGSMQMHTERIEDRGKSSSGGGPSAQPPSEHASQPSSTVVRNGEALSPAGSRLRASGLYEPGQIIIHPASGLECRVTDVVGHTIAVMVAGDEFDVVYLNHRTGRLAAEDPYADCPF